jgi:hypothetical protein
MGERATMVHGAEPRFHKPGTPVMFRKRDRRDLGNNPEPNPFSNCDYCGSIDIDEVIQAFKTPGTHWSGSDWKYGYPHKFYVDLAVEPYMAVKGSTSKWDELLGKSVNTLHEPSRCTTVHYKFYTDHLKEATEEQLREFNEVVSKVTGIIFEVHDEDFHKQIGRGKLLYYRAPRQDWQDYGEIQADGTSKRPEFAVR